VRSALAYEFVRIRTIRSSWVLTGLSLSFTLIYAVGSAVSPVVGLDTSTRLLGDQAEYAAVLTVSTQFTPLLMGLLGAFAFGHEYRYGTMRTALRVLPRRTTLAAAKVLAIALWSAAVAGIGVALSAVALVLLGRGRFEPGTSLTAGNTPRVAMGVVVYVVLFASMGLAFGWLFRNLQTAVTILLILPLMVEPLLRLLLAASGLGPAAEVGHYLPFGADRQLYAYTTQMDARSFEPFRNDLSPLAGGLTMAAVTAFLLALAHLRFQRRDA
jgi:ABC-2 type transport system permease protein